MSGHYKSIAAYAMMVVLTFGLTTCKKEKIDPPTVKVLENVITIGITKASVSAEVTDQGGAEVKLRGFVYGLLGGSLDTVFCGSGTGVYSTELNNLLPNTTYVYEAFAKNIGGIGVSEKVTFATNPLPSYTIHVSASPSNGGIVCGSGSFQQGQYCSVMAIANEGYIFTNWAENDNEVCTDASYTFMVDGDRILTANFTVQSPNEYTISVSVNPDNGGTINGGGIYQEGRSCTVSATANDGYVFTNWTENGNEVSSNAVYTFTVTSNRTLVANFTIQTPNTYSINVSANPAEGGSVTGSGTYQHGQQCTIAATENYGYTFTSWTENGQVVSGAGANYTFTVTGNRTLVANFNVQVPNTYTINVSANPTGGGTMTGGGTYQQGQDCTVTASSNEGYSFINWTENGAEVSARTSYTFPVNSNRTLVANFTTQQPNVYTINVSANPAEGGTVTGNSTYQYGQNGTVTAISNEGYNFINWTENGNEVSIDAQYTFVVTGNRTLVAQFQAQSYTISTSANPVNGGTIAGAGNYNYGQSCTLSATAANGYTFTNWTENGSQLSTNANYTFTVTGNRTLVANFTYSGTGSHDYIDLGLPSGLLWATCNVGADTPEDYGDYFAWGETQPKSVYNWSTYQHCNGSDNTLTKYCDNPSYGYNGFTDNLITLLPEDDAATANWGSNWRMPIQAEWHELLNNTTVTWITQDGVNGMLFTAMNGNCLFLPAAGYRYENSHCDYNTFGFYWSISLCTGWSQTARDLLYLFLDEYIINNDYRCRGHSVRPVREN